MKPRSKRFYIVLAVAAALATMTVKFIGYFLTGSVGLFSDAAESVVNLVAALVALWAITLATRPADEEHTYGHTKSEYFSSGVEGALIVVAALIIAVEAIPRLLHPQPLEQVGLGLAFSVSGAVINAVLAWFMLRAGKQQRSIVLQADARHLFADVFTTAGVLVGVLLVAVTGWLILDPIVALLVAANIIWTGARLLHETGLGLLDEEPNLRPIFALRHDILHLSAPHLRPAFLLEWTDDDLVYVPQKRVASRVLLPSNHHFLNDHSIERAGCSCERYSPRKRQW